MTYLWKVIEKMGIRQFMKRKSISGSRSVENISDKRWRTEVQPIQTNGVERVKRFVNVHLHCIASNLKRKSKISTFLPWKNFCGRPRQQYHKSFDVYSKCTTVCLQQMHYCLFTANALLFVYSKCTTVCLQQMHYCLFTANALLFVYSKANVPSNMSNNG